MSDLKEEWWIMVHWAGQSARQSVELIIQDAYKSCFQGLLQYTRALISCDEGWGWLGLESRPDLKRIAFFFYFRLVLIENLGSWYNLYWLVKATAEYMQTAIKYHLLLSLLLLEGPFCYASAEWWVVIRVGALRGVGGERVWIGE